MSDIQEVDIFNPNEGLDAKQPELLEEVQEQDIKETASVTEEESPSPIHKYSAKQVGDYSSLLNNDRITYTFSLPSVSLHTFSEKLQTFDKLKLDVTDKSLQKWKKVNEDLVEYYTPTGLYQERFSDPKSLFEQGIENEEGLLKTMGPIKFKKTEGEIKGELALLKVSKLLGLGEVVNVPLPHSGIWVTIKPPTEKDLIDLYNSIFREKILLGRTTFGFTLTNFSVYINNRILDFILHHVHSVNNQEMDKSNLKNYILIHDYPILAWAFASTIYPNGFSYQRACVNDIEKCSYVAKALLNMNKLLWIDNSSLSSIQKSLLNENRPNKLTLNDYNKYISETSRRSSEFTTPNGVKIKLRIPTFSEYNSDGMTWVNKINSAIESAVIEEGNEEDARIQLLNQYVKSSILRQYSHFIDYIEADDSIINDRDTINDVLEALSADDESRVFITKKVLEFKSYTTIALIGIPEYKCPQCGSNQLVDPVNDAFVNVIPLDVINLFFSLITLRITKITSRDI